MRTVEVSASTREDAITKALKDLGVERHEAHVEILDEGSKGFLGMGKRDVRVRVSADVPDLSPPPRTSTEESRPRRDDRPAQNRGERGGRDRASEQNRRGERADRPRTARNGRDEAKPRAQKPEARVPKSEPPRRPAPAPREDPEAVREEIKPLTPEQRKIAEHRAGEASALLQEVIDRMGIESKVSGSVNEEGVLELDVKSEDSAILIGRKGRSLLAMQYLINRMMQDVDETDETERIIIDIEGYQERRRASLDELAHRMAAKVKETGRRVRMKPLNPQERRVIHVALQDDTDIRTFSVGSSSVRCVVIAPAREEQGENNNNGPEGQRAEGGRRRGGRGRRRGSRNRGPSGERATNNNPDAEANS